MQRCLDRAEGEQRQAIVSEVIRHARRLVADQAPVRLDRRRAQPLVLRVDGGGEDVLIPLPVLFTYRLIYNFTCYPCS